MGCTSSADAKCRYTVALQEGGLATELVVYVRSNLGVSPTGFVGGEPPCGLRVSHRIDHLVVNRVERHSPLQRRLKELQREFPSSDITVRKGDHVVQVNGEQGVDGMLRALQWQQTVHIRFRRYEKHHGRRAAAKSSSEAQSTESYRPLSPPSPVPMVMNKPVSATSSDCSSQVMSSLPPSVSSAIAGGDDMPERSPSRTSLKQPTSRRSGMKLNASFQSEASSSSTSSFMAVMVSDSSHKQPRRMDANSEVGRAASKGRSSFTSADGSRRGVAQTPPYKSSL
mmetsp:Transcript_20080/g.46792  ORF Transcript_20080/g.46792 Transcript_20080/m.46792 type:complete len:283 (-) Transcript_20080:139-987(-)